MSDRVGLKTKENAAKKFSSLNLNQTYKGTKVEPKASTGIPRHGLQSLGKVATSRRMPPPANLPSLKSENLGNDPTVALVPSGGGGWGSSKEKEATTTTTTATNKSTTQGPATAIQQQSQQPSKPTDTSQKATTGQQTSTGQTTSTSQTSATTKTWASSSSNVAGGQERTSYPHQSQYFNQEFPTLGGGNSKDKLPEERASHQPYGQPPRNTHDPPWMDKGGSGPPPPKPSFGMYNGAPYPGPPQRPGYGPQMYNREGHPLNNHARPEGSENFPYMGISRPSNYAAHPAAQRGHPGSRTSGPMPPKHMIKLEDSPSGYVRPSIVNEEDIRAMDSEDVEDGGWAGAQEEIDYSIKLNFDDDETASPTGRDSGQSDGQNKSARPVREPQQSDWVVNGDFNRTQPDSKHPNEPGQAWAVSADGRNNFQPQWIDQARQRPYNAQGPFNAQRSWPHHYPPVQQRNAFPMGPQPGPPNTPGGRPHPQDQNRTGSTGADKSMTSVAIEHARQRKLHEEEERKRQQDAAAREKLRLLDERTRPVQIQTHEVSVREQAGPRSPVSPAGSDAPIRRIMRRKDSGSVGDDDGSSVKSVESVGKEEKKSLPESKNHVNKPIELRKTSSSNLQEERKSPALKRNDDERKAHDTPSQVKDKLQRKSSLNKDAKETAVEKPKNERDVQRVESSRQKREEDKVASKVPAVDVRDAKKHVEDQEKRPERKSSESRPRSDEAFTKKSQHEADESRENNKRDYESRKENFANRGNRLGSKNERGSSESVRSRDSIEKRKDDRRPEDIKRKREDFERNEPLSEQGNRDRGPNRDRLYNSRGRTPLGAKSYLRGHPKSYSNARADRTATQRRNRTRNDSKDYADDEIKTVAPEEKVQASENTGESHWAESDKRKPDANRRQPDNGRRQADDGRRQPDDGRRQPDDGRRQGDDSRGQLDNGRRQPDGSRRPPASYRPQADGGGEQDNDKRRQPDNDKRPPYTEKNHRDESRRQHEKRETEEGKQPINDNRRKSYQDSRFYNVDKRNDRGIRDDRSYKGSGRLPSRPPADRSERFRDTSRNKGGFGRPPPKEQPKEGENEEKFKDERGERGKTKPILSTTDYKKSEEKGTNSLDKVTASKDVYVPPVTNSWAVPESRDVTKEAKNEDHLDSAQKTTTESDTEKSTTNVSKDSNDDKTSDQTTVTERQSSLISDGKKHDNKESNTATSAPAKSNQQDSKIGERRERTLPNREQQYKTNRNFSKSDTGDSKVEKRRDQEAFRENRQNPDSKFHDKRTRPRDDPRREQPKRSTQRKSTLESSGGKFDEEQSSKEKQRKDGQGSESRFEGRRGQKDRRDAAWQSDGTQQRGDRFDRRDNASYRDRKDQEKSEQRSRSERNRTDRRDRTEQGLDRHDRPEQCERIDRQGRTEQRERTDGRDMTEPRDHTESKDETPKPSDDTRRKPRDNDNENNKNAVQDESRPKKEGTSRTSYENDKSTKQVDDLSTTKKQSDRFSVGSISPRVDRRPYGDSRRGAPSTRRGARGGIRGMRGRGRGRPLTSGRFVGKGNVPSKDNDDNDSEEFHSVGSSVFSDSDGADSEEDLPKQDDRQRDERHSNRSYSSSGQTRQLYSSRGGRGRGNSQLPRSPRKYPEKPPRFQKQDQARSASRGRGKGTRGGYNSREKWDVDISRNNDNRTSDEGPSPKKRPPDSTFANEKGSDGAFRGRKSTRGGHSNNRSSFLAKKQQEVVEGSSKKGGARFGAKSAIPAALTTHGRNERRAKNEPVSADVDENLEPPKKNPRRTEPPKTGIEHIDMSNIAGFIDIDDIVQPSNEVEPASPQSGFVEVKSKRTQKELREKAREEEERKRRELEKMMQDALLKPKANKPTLMNKQHTTSKPPRFARNALVASNVISTLPDGNAPPRGDTPVVSPENSTITALAAGNVEQKRTSPLIMEKPSSPPPPPMFNAWTKPLSITPAKPPNAASVELSRIMHPDPLAVGSGKPQRASGIQPKAEEPELQIQLTLPDTFQAIPTERDIDSQSTESRMFRRVDETGSGERHAANANGRSKKTKDETIAEPAENKKADRIQADSKTQNSKTTDASVNTDKNAGVETDKRQSSGNNWNSDRTPRFEKSVTGKNKSDGRRLKTDTKDISGEPKSQAVLADANKASNEKNDGRPRSSSRPRDVNKTQKPKPQVKTAKTQTVDENGEQPTERNSQEKTENEEHKQNMNKRDSVELDVQSMSESLLDETTLRMVETSKAGTGTTSMVKIKSEDDIKMDYEMQEKMVAAKKAWDHSISSSASIQTSQWKASVTDEQNSESTEVSVVDQIPRPSPETEESAEPLGTVSTPRLKKPTGSEQQNVCKVKPQQQQQPVKPQPVPSNEVPEDYPSSNAIQRSTLESEAQTNYAIQTHQTAFSTSKPATQGFLYSFEQQALLPINHQYVQTDMATISQHHVSPVRPQTLHAASHSPQQRASTYPQGQSVSTPSPLSHQPLLHDTYRPLMPTALYPTNAFASNQYFPISLVRPAAPAQFQPTVNEDINHSMYTAQASKSQNPSHGYEPAVPTAQQMFVPVEQPSYSEYVQSRQHPVGFYRDATSHAGLGGLPAHMQKSMTFPQNDKQVQTQHSRDSRTPSGRHEQQQVYAPVSQSEMSKHVHAKPFQPPASSPSPSAAHHFVPSVRQVPSGPNNISPAYHVNNAVLPLQAAGAPGLQVSVSSSDHSATTPIVTQAHALPVSRLGFHHFTSAVSSIQRQVPVPVQQLPPHTYPAALTYRTPVASFPTTTSVANQTGVLMPKPTPVMRQIVTAGRGAGAPHRMPEPIQRPSKSVFHAGSLKEKQLSPQQRLKSVHQMPGARRSFNPVGVAQAPMAATYQFPAFSGQQPSQPQQQQQQQQQIFRNQQHRLMVSNAQQFFAEDKEMEQRKQKQANQKRDQTPIAATTSTLTGGNATSNQQAIEDKRKQQPKIQHELKQETKTQKSVKDEQKKRVTRQQTPDRRGVRTAQIPPQRSQGRLQNRPKPSIPKQEPVKTIQQLSAVAPGVPKEDAQKIQDKFQSRLGKKADELQAEVGSAASLVQT